MASIVGMRLSSCKTLSFSSSPTLFSSSFLQTKPSIVSFPATRPRKPTIIRMGGGPRTYPGGVSKWQWKRMQAKKQKQLLKARLCRERQIYEMRKRAELKAAVAELERPWEPVEKPPNLFSVSADEQLKVLADRFQRPGGFDLWTDRDGPQLFPTADDFPSARFFPKGVVHSVKPYGKISGSVDSDGEEDMVKGNETKGIVQMNGENRTIGKQRGRRLRKKVGFKSRSKREGEQTKGIQDRVYSDELKNGGSQVYEMSLRRDGTYEFGS